MAQSPATIKLKSFPLGGAEYDFSKDELPLISRRISNDRLDDQGPSIRRIDVTLNGFHTGKNLAEVQAKHKGLIVFLRSNELTLTYTDGVSTIVDQQVCWVDDYNEPSEWRQYSGNYTIALHYFEEAEATNIETIQCSLVNSLGTLTLDPAPLFAINAGRSQGSFRASDLTPANAAAVFNQQDIERPITREAVITLEGFMTGLFPDALVAKRNNMLNMTQKKVTLNYGSYTTPATVLRVNFPPTFPRRKCYYTLELQTDLGVGVRFLSTTRDIPRVHRNPLIRERPQCNLPPYVMESGLSGQEIHYGFSILGDSMAAMRATLRTEAAYAIFPGGYEMPGGVMREDDDAMSINLTIIKFYPTPIIPNLFGTDNFTPQPQ